MKNAYSLLMRLNCKHVKMCMGKKTAFLPKTNMHNYHTKYLVKSQVYFTTFCPICKEGKNQKRVLRAEAHKTLLVAFIILKP